MKKIIALVSLLVLVLSLSACGKFTCDMCGKESSGGHDVEYQGAEGTLCDDCYEIWEAAENLSKAMGM